MKHREFEKPSLVNGVRLYIPIPSLNTLVTTEQGEIAVIESLGIKTKKSAAQVYDGKGEKVSADRYKFETETDYNTAQQALEKGKFPSVHRSKLAF